MTELILSMMAFLATHALPAFRPVRARAVGLIGERAYLIVYSLLSLGMLTWVGLAFSRAPYIELWSVTEPLRWVPFLVMPLACMLLWGGLTSHNPFSITLRPQGFDPAKPGIIAVTRHPVIWAFALWALSHLAVNGDAASVLMFGALFVICLVGPLSLDGKRRTSMGDADWAEAVRETSNLPFVALLRGRVPGGLAAIGWRPVLGGLALFLGLIALHPHVIGVSPLP